MGAGAGRLLQVGHARRAAVRSQHPECDVSVPPPRCTIPRTEILDPNALQAEGAARPRATSRPPRYSPPSAPTLDPCGSTPVKDAEVIKVDVGRAEAPGQVAGLATDADEVGQAKPLREGDAIRRP